MDNFLPHSGVFVAVSMMCCSRPADPCPGGEFRALGTRTVPLYYESMLATERDRQIILTVGAFNQLTSSHVKTLLFPESKSQTPVTRALTRLVASKHLARIERRLVGGLGAGSGQYVYQLGTKGWELCGRDGRYWPFRSVDYHTLAIADVFTNLKKLETTGTITLRGYETEPNSWREVAGAKLLPDLYVEIDLPAKRTTAVAWIEVDTGTERQKQIRDKLERYWHARQHVNIEQIAVWPLVVFIAPDQQRIGDLQRWLKLALPEAQDLFVFHTQDSFMEALVS